MGKRRIASCESVAPLPAGISEISLKGNHQKVKGEMNRDITFFNPLGAMTQIIASEVTLVFAFQSEVEILSTSFLGHLPISLCRDFLGILATSVNVVTTSDFATDIIKKLIY